MMISPDYFYTRYCAGKSREELLTQADELKAELTHLQQILEDPSSDDPDLHIIPSPRTRAKMAYEYLEMVKKAMTEQGFAYPATMKEKTEEAFEKKLNELSRFCYSISDMCGSEIYTVSFETDDNPLFTYEENPGNVDKRAPDTFCDKAEFIDSLHDAHIGGWRTHYINPTVLDGFCWSVTMCFADGTKKEFYGQNACPWSFDIVTDIFEELKDYQDN